MASATPAVLRWARESQGLDVPTAAKRIGIKEEVLLAAETRTDSLTFAQLTKAASVYKRSLAVFLLPRPPSEPSIVADFRHVVGAVPSMSPELRFELRRVTRKREIAAQLGSLGERAGTEDLWSFVGSLRGNEDPAAVGKQLRTVLGVTVEARKAWRDDYKTFNWWRAQVENLGPLVFLVSRIDVSEMRGFSIARKPFPVIVLNRADSPRARLFSLIHELTHVYVGNSGLCDFSEEAHPDVDVNVEVFCNAVAAETLMPREQVTTHVTVRAHKRGSKWTDTELRAVASDFGVSDDAMLYRLVKLNLATAEEYAQARKRWELAAQAKSEDDAGGGGERAHERVLRMQGRPYVQLVLGAMHRDEITASDVSDYLDVKLDHLKDLERAAIGLDVPRQPKAAATDETAERAKRGKRGERGA